MQSGLFASGDHILAAVSGGPDSMALLCALETCRARLGITISAGHFDHRLRTGSGRDRIYVEAFCADRGIPCHSGSDDIASRAHQSGESIEQAARRYRYRFLRETATRIGARWIATGHTRNDQVETVLMRVMRGAGIRGLSGIPRRRGPLTRPLLEVARAETVAFCREWGVEFIDDPSNTDVRHTRNRVRHEVLPGLRAGFPDVDDYLLGLARNATEALAHVRRTTGPLLDRAAREEKHGVWTVDVAAIEGLDALARHVFFADLLNERMQRECDAGRAHYERLDRMSRRDTRSGRMLSLPGVAVRREHGSLVFYPGVRHPDEVARHIPEQVLEVPGHTRVPGAQIDVAVVPRAHGQSVRAASETPGESGRGGASSVAYFALESLRRPLVIRSPHSGDRMRPFGMNGHKKLSDIFVDRKIPARERAESLVVSDRNEVVWLVGVATSENTRVGDDSSQVVRITVST